MAIQCNLSLTENQLFSSLDKGIFSTLIEYKAPSVSQPLNLAVALGIAITKEINKFPEILGLSVNYDNDSHSLLDTAGVLRQALNEDFPMNLIISGQNQNRRTLLSQLSQAESKSILNATFVTGDLLDDSEQNTYVDSVQMLHFAEPFKNRIRFGATINPFKYTAEDMFLQYHKMMRKLLMGASFLITQSGYDMAKYQELQWYLQERDIQVPVIARLNLLTADDAQNLHNGLHAGVPISRSFTAMIQRELKEDSATFMQRQLKRLELQIAGCKLFGYSGVQIVGIKEVPLLAKVAEVIRNATTQYTDYANWLEQWNDFNRDYIKTENPQAFYGYNQLMTPGHCLYSQDVKARHVTFSQPETSSCREKLIEFLINPKQPSVVQSLTRHIWLDNTTLSYTALQRIFFQNPTQCPKQLTCGACGGSKFDGTCEKGDRICMYHNILKIAHRRNNLNVLEMRINPNE